MREHKFSQFYPQKRNFLKNSLDSSKPQDFSSKVAETPNLEANSPEVGMLLGS